jgi:transposase InsO family protein
VRHDLRDEVVDFVNELVKRTDLPCRQVVGWLGVGRGKFYAWRDHYGQDTSHNGKVPRDHWLEAEEVEAIVKFHALHPLEGYRRLAFMMLDEDVVAVSPSSVYRVLRVRGLLDRWNRKPSRKGSGFVQPGRAHEHWHIDVSYLNVAGTFYYLCSILDGYSRFIVHWEIRESMRESDVATIVQRARERFPGVTPRIISDNGPQFLAREFKAFLRLVGMTHVKTSPYYPQSNGKIERWHRTVKHDAIRAACPSTLEEARRVVERFVQHYNHVRLHSAIDYVSPADKLAGREKEIWAKRDQKLEAARAARKRRREEAVARAAASITNPVPVSCFR